MKKVFLVLFLICSMLVMFTLQAKAIPKVDEYNHKVTITYTWFDASRPIQNTVKDSGGHTGYFSHNIEMPPCIRPSRKSIDQPNGILLINEWIPENEALTISCHKFNDIDLGYLMIYEGPVWCYAKVENGEAFPTQKCFGMRMFRFRYWFGVDQKYDQFSFTTPNYWGWSEDLEKNGNYFPPASFQECDSVSNDFVTAIRNKFGNNPNMFVFLDTNIWSFELFGLSSDYMSIVVADYVEGHSCPGIWTQRGSTGACKKKAKYGYVLIVKKTEAPQILDFSAKWLISRFQRHWFYEIDGLSWTPPN